MHIIGAQTPPTKLINNLNSLRQAIILTFLRCNRVKPQIVLINGVYLLPFPRNLQRKRVKNDLPEHNPKAKDIILLRILIILRLLWRSIWNREPPPIAIGQIQMPIHRHTRLPEINQPQHKGTANLQLIGHDLHQHVLRLQIVMDDPVVPEETQADCDLVHEEELCLEGYEVLVYGKVGVDGFLRAVLEENLIVEV